MILCKAFNGRFFNEIETTGELMHAVFLSEPIIQVKQNLGSGISTDIKLLNTFQLEHKHAHFDILPSCPSCLERLDSSLSGLQQVPIISVES